MLSKTIFLELVCMSWDSGSTRCGWLLFEGDPLVELSSEEILHLSTKGSASRSTLRPRLVPLLPPLWTRDGPRRNDPEAQGPKQPP